MVQREWDGGDGRHRASFESLGGGNAKCSFRVCLCLFGFGGFEEFEGV